MKSLHAGFAIAAFTLIAAADTEIKVQMKDLPQAVQDAVKRETANAKLTGLNKETEHGQTMYEAETTVDGHSRDVLFDKTGAVVEVEEQVDMSDVPSAAKEALQRKAAGATIKKVEKSTRGSNVSYEATVIRNGKRSEVAVNADGSSHKEE